MSGLPVMAAAENTAMALLTPTTADTTSSTDTGLSRPMDAIADGSKSHPPFLLHSEARFLHLVEQKMLSLLAASNSWPHHAHVCLIRITRARSSKGRHTERHAENPNGTCRWKRSISFAQKNEGPLRQRQR